jgi:hypothetical protein
MKSQGRKALTGKQDNFARGLFAGLSQREAYLRAGYSPRQSRAALDINACRLAENPKLVLRVAALRKQADDALIMVVRERMIRLSEIGRARLVDFLDAQGNPILDKNMANNGGVAEFVVETRLTKKGETVITRKIRLYDPVAAIVELNKMDLYSEGVTINQAIVIPQFKVVMVRHRREEGTDADGGLKAGVTIEGVNDQG